MAKDKERSVNPAQQARRQEKTRALKKAKNEQQARRNEKLARRNPDRIQRQIDDLKALEAAGEIKPREKAILADLERDLRAVHKARDALGEKASNFGNARPRNDQAGIRNGGAGRGGNILGKRGRDGEHRQSQPRQDQNSDSGGETDESVRNIPMPRDTPPPIPHAYQRSNTQRYHHQKQDTDPQSKAGAVSTPVIEPKTTYSSAPQLRDLRKEATSRFVPTAVKKKKQDAVKGIGGELLEPEELDRLEAAGYYKVSSKDIGNEHGVPVVDDAEAKRLAEEEARFEQELAASGDMDVDENDANQDIQPNKPLRSHHVQIEEVEDEDL